MQSVVPVNPAKYNSALNSINFCTTAPLPSPTASLLEGVHNHSSNLKADGWNKGAQDNMQRDRYAEPLTDPGVLNCYRPMTPSPSLAPPSLLPEWEKCAIFAAALNMLIFYWNFFLLEHFSIKGNDVTCVPSIGYQGSINIVWRAIGISSTISC